MKKSAVLILVLLCSSAWLAAQSAEITVPQANAVLTFGEQVMVQWTYTGKATVKFQLFGPNGAKIGPIKSGVALTSGSFSWTVGMLENGQAVATSKGYTLQMVKTDGVIVILDKAAGPFEIAGAPATPVPTPSPATIKVTSPKSGDEWCPGSAYSITWTKTGAMSANVAIRLRLAASPPAAPDVLVIANNVTNSGSFPWTIPGSVPTGDYIVLVNTDDPAVIPICPVFKIVNCLTPPAPPVIPPGNPPPANMIVLNRSSRVNPVLITPSLRVSQPAAGDVLKPGDTFPITWSLVGGGYNEVKIMMYPAGQPHLARAGQVRWIAQTAPNSGVFSWKLDANERTGKHVVRVQTLDDKIFGDSGAFSIAAAPGLTLMHVRAPDIKTLLADQATIAIQLLDFQMLAQGELNSVGMIVNVNSSSGFVLTPALGHPQYGSLYARCVIEVPNTDKNGNFTAVKVLDAVYSLKGAPPFKLDAHPTNIGWAEAKFNAGFDPDCKGQAQGQKVVQKMKSGPFEGGKLCILEYYPKLTVTLHLVTKNGEAVAEKTIYIHYDANQWPMGSVFLPGEVNSCPKKGMQKW